MPFDEIRDHSGDLAHLQIAATAQFAGDVLGNIFRPALGGIEGDDADRVTILAGQQVLNYRFDVGVLLRARRREEQEPGIRFRHTTVAQHLLRLGCRDCARPWKYQRRQASYSAKAALYFVGVLI